MTQHKMLRNRGFNGKNFILSIVRQSLIFFVSLHQLNIQTYEEENYSLYYRHTWVHHY